MYSRRAVRNTNTPNTTEENSRSAMARLEAGLAKTSRDNRTMFRPWWATNQPTTEGTRETLVRTARQLFADRGYAGAGTWEDLPPAGPTRGALRHHFPVTRAPCGAAYSQA